MLIFSGDKMEGSRPLLCENKTPNEMKKIIVTEVKNFRDADKEMFLKGSIQIKDVKERYRDIGKNTLVSLYGCAFFFVLTTKQKIKKSRINPFHDCKRQC